MPTLTEKTIQNVGLVAALQLSAAVISTLTLVVLARLLTPYDFGVVAVAGIALSFIGQLSDFGLSSAVVQRPDPSGRAVDVAATIRLLLSVVLILSTFVIAAPVADLIAVPAAANVIRVSSLLWLLAGAGFASNALLWKELRFRALAVIGVVSSVAGAFISIVLALGGFSYWSIVLGNIGSAAVTLCALWAVRPWRLRFAFDRTLARQFLSFGKHVFVLGILVFAFQNVDNIAVAKMLGVSALGFYYLAYKWATVVSGFVTRTVGRVLFPTYSSIQDQPARLRRGFQSSFRAISLASFPAQIGILLVAPEFVTLVLGANWVPAIRPLQILTFLGLMTVLLQPFGDLFLATGRAAYLSRTNILNVALIVPLAFPVASAFGLQGIAVLVVVIYTQHVIVVLWLAAAKCAISLREVGQAMRAPVLGAAGMTASVFAIKFTLPPGWTLLLLEVLIGAIMYSLVAYRLDRGFVVQVFRALRGHPTPTPGPEPALPRP